MNREASRRRTARPSNSPSTVSALIAHGRALTRWAVRLATHTGPPGLAMARPSGVRRRIQALQRQAFRANLPRARVRLLQTVGLVLVTLVGTAGLTQAQSEGEGETEHRNSEGPPQKYRAMRSGDDAAGGPAAQSPRLDPFGDELPEGAIARLGTIRFRHRSNVQAVAISPDSGLVASASRDGEVRLWEAESGKLLYILDPDRALPLQALAFSPDGRFLAAGSGIVLPPLPPGEPFGSWWLWEVESGRVVREVHFRSQEGEDEEEEQSRGSDNVTVIAFSPDGGTLATGHASGDVRIWDTASREELLMLPLMDRDNGSFSPKLAFSPDGTLLALHRGRRRRADIEIWNVDTEENTLTLKTKAADDVISLSFAPNGTDLFAGYSYSEREEMASGKPYFASRGKVLVWNPNIGGEPHEFPQLDAGIRPNIAMSANGQILAVATKEGIVVWDFPARRPLRTLDSPHKRYLQQLQALAISPSGDRVVAATHHGRPVVFVWDARTGRLLPEPFGSHFSEVWAAGFFAGDAKIATKDGAGFLRTWNAETGELLLNGEPTYTVDRGWSIAQTGMVVKAPSNSLDESWLIEFWDANTGKQKGQQSVPGEVAGTAISADGSLAAAAYGNLPYGYGSSSDAINGIRVWNTASGEQMADLALAQTTAIAVGFASDRPVLFYIAADKQPFWSLLSWNFRTGERRTIIEEMKGVNGGLSTSVALSRDARVLAACTTELLPERRWRIPAVVYVYDLKDARQLSIEVPETASNILAISPDNRVLATAGVQGFSPAQELDEAIYLWDLSTGEQIKKVGQPDAAVTAMDFSSDGQRLVTATAMGTALVWDVR